MTQASIPHSHILKLFQSYTTLTLIVLSTEPEKSRPLAIARHVTLLTCRMRV